MDADAVVGGVAAALGEEGEPGVARGARGVDVDLDVLAVVFAFEGEGAAGGEGGGVFAALLVPQLQLLCIMHVL